MEQTCRNCLNAYNSPHYVSPQCVNKEWEAQFRAVDTSVRPDESCGTWQRRNDSQPPVEFPKVIQLTLFD